MLSLLYKWIKYPFFGQFMVSWRNPLSAEEALEWKRFRFPSASGGEIQGMYAPARTVVAKATIVLGHPMGKEAKGYFLKRGYTDLLRDHGFNTLLFDINGFGESSHGSLSYFEDIVAAGLQAQKLNPDLPIGYLGVSLGAQWATIAFADERHPFQVAILESPGTSLEEFWVMFPFAYRMLKLMYFFIPAYARKIKMVERIREAKHLKQLLLIYSEKDDWMPVSMGERFQKNSAVPTELWRLQTAAHAEVMKSEERELYCQRILDFFDQLVPTPQEVGKD